MEKIKIIYYPGTWDIPHIGHINALNYVINYPLEFKHKLIIGIESDKLCIQNKRNPIYNEQERKKFIKKYSDFFPLVYYNYNYRFHYAYDIFACGLGFGERQDQKEHIKWCNENGIQILHVPRTQGISTSKIIERIQKWEKLD